MQEPELTLLFTRRLNALGARYMVSGSVAAGIYGAPRLTNDVDVIVVLDRAQIARLPEVFAETEFYLPPLEAIAEEAARAEHGHFNIIHHETGFKADIYLAGRDPLHAWALARARRLDVAGEPFVVAPPEYVILRKLEFYREGRARESGSESTSATSARCSTPRRTTAPSLSG
jgi:predicted nucleotidyltransferase